MTLHTRAKQRKLTFYIYLVLFCFFFFLMNVSPGNWEGLFVYLKQQSYFKRKFIVFLIVYESIHINLKLCIRIAVWKCSGLCSSARVCWSHTDRVSILSLNHTSGTALGLFVCLLAWASLPLAGRSSDEDQAEFELREIHLPLPHKCWDFRLLLPCLPLRPIS